MQTRRVSVSSGGVGLTTAQMMDPAVLSLNGWASDPNWVLDAGKDYPRLAWEGAPGQMVSGPHLDWLGGSGTEEEPYTVATTDQLARIARASILWNRYFILTSDLDLLGVDSPWIGRTGCPFTGHFFGGGHVIRNLIISLSAAGQWEVGFFGVIGADGYVDSVGIEDALVTIQGNSWYVGALAGVNQGAIANSYVKGIVKGNKNLGALVGSNRGTISDCYAHGSVTGSDILGGLAGVNFGAITHSYASVLITSSDPLKAAVGGLIAQQAGDDQAMAVGCFWDITTSGILVSSGGTGVMAAQMKTASTFRDAAWDFSGETANGSEDIWWILEGQDYPRLWWEKGIGSQ
jgi:hypothetical protein